jgi:hypothetical protein
MVDAFCAWEGYRYVMVFDFIVYEIWIEINWRWGGVSDGSIKTVCGLVRENLEKNIIV